MKAVLICFTCLLWIIASFEALCDELDRIVCNKTFAWAFEHRLIDKPIGEITAEIGMRFVGAPYIAGSLDSVGSERLVVNLRAFDCVTFVENSLALARCVKGNTLAWDSYTAGLERIRYRGGKLAGYPSRLHYFLDWIADNETKGIITDVTRECGGVEFAKTINFMSRHRGRYPRMDDAALDSIRVREQAISAMKHWWIPKDRVAAASRNIRTGDIIAIVTSIEGLDIGHTGLALRLPDGTLHLLHAPDVGKTVTVSESTLAGYLKAHPKQAGIMVLRPREPGAGIR